nr:hypothetical protein CKG001_12120 [Bdellovibrio sp. CKG001]BFD62483.1 hypothetical protein BdHM001_11640 [Bdellovibrio sp. HM001]
MNTQNISQQLDRMDRELRFLWQEAHEESIQSIRERKLKQYWELFKAYKKQKQFLMALDSK